MSSLHCFLLVAFFIHSCPPFATPFVFEDLLRSLTTDQKVDNLAEAVYRFGTEIHKIILKSNPDGNVFFSPTSLYLCLAMLHAGSDGETKSQLASVLELHVFEQMKKKNELHDSIKFLLETLNSANKTNTLKMANRLFLQKGFEIKDEFLRKTEEYFRAELESLDFGKDPSGSRSKINNWVSGMTSEKIKELFPEDSITSDTVLALANAVYFNDSWLKMFDKKNTKSQTFSISTDEEIQVPMMHQSYSKGLRYITSEYMSFKLLELPYKDESVSMIIVLDETNTSRPDFAQILTGIVADASWDQLVDINAIVPIRLSLPKFSLAQTLVMKDSLHDLGLKNLFENADLSGITDSRALQLSEAIHKSYINVNEGGTEAAAATGLGFQVMSAMIPNEKEIDFIVDRPFVFFVFDKKTGCVLFFGHVQNPLKTD